MSAPRTKRPFAGASSDPAQRQITSFFTTRSGPAPPAESPPTPASDILPSEVQSNLLSVGMRVRKSVPEGYKTGTYSGFKLWSDTSDHRDPVVRTTKAAGTLNNSTSTTTRRSAAAQLELMPFCGINKVGGLASQPAHASEEEDCVPSLDDMPGLTSSQETVESVEDTASDPRSKKRFFADEDTDGPVQVWTSRTASLESELGPRSLTASGWANARPFAVPRKSRRKPDVEQENLVVDDFDEADFLVSPDADMSDA
ncbi:ribonucleotide reductase inhibitor [Colletotrichum tabaci]|uniref:Ribonucleotide reductase inhibitor n=1 Tax=Colletotrichum tabaci TaxID=1209068 RepID=A0AAV9TP77_9PEZI